MAKTKSTEVDEIEILGRLSPGASAHLAGVSKRILRDAVGLPRAADGSYNARDVAKWAAGRLPTKAGELTDEDFEILRTIADQFHAFSDGQAGTIITRLADLRRKYGEAAFVQLVGMFLDDLRSLAESVRFDESAESLRQQAAYRRQQEVERLAQDELRILVVCECGRYRRGRKWIKGELPQDHAKVMTEGCPACKGKELES
ncbi:MAG: hypothetical protein NTY19_11650 [Planctomycetota bacterium]|nr:hypothetical protein [Planctomycetota bacterium]